MFYYLAKRFIAGEDFSATVPNLEALSSAGFALTVDLLGESVDTREAAIAATNEYLMLIEQLAERGIDCHISIKLTQLGLDIDEALARDQLFRLAVHAHERGGFVRVDMEGSDYTGQTLQIVGEVHRQVPCVGTVLQSMLHRSKEDLEALCAERVPVRLVKGAYKESAEYALQKRQDICANFLRLSHMLLASGNAAAIATHDPEVIAAVQQQAVELGLARDQVEFQFLYGVRRDLQQQILREGWKVRIYTPYGDAWMPYVMRRMRERKENVWFVVKNLFQG